METVVFSSPTIAGIAMELMHYLCWLLKIFPWTFRTNFQAAFWVRGPAVESLIVEIVRISVCIVLNYVVAFAVEVSVTLEHLRPVASCKVLVR